MSGNVKFDKWINDDNSENYKCRAWVNFNGTGTVAIRASGNVSSITDNGAGDYTVNFTNAISDANFSSNITNSLGSSYGFAMSNTNNSAQVVTPTTTSMRFVLLVFNASSFMDAQFCHVSVFR